MRAPGLTAAALLCAPALVWAQEGEALASAFSELDAALEALPGDERDPSGAEMERVRDALRALSQLEGVFESERARTELGPRCVYLASLPSGEWSELVDPLEFLDLARIWSDAAGDELTGGSAESLRGELLLERGELSACIQGLSASLERWPELPELRPRMRFLLADALRMSTRYGDCLQELQRARADLLSEFEAESFGYWQHLDWMEIHSIRSAAELALGLPDLAQSSLEQATQAAEILARDFDDPSSLVVCLIRKCDAAILSEDYQAVYEAYDAGRALGALHPSYEAQLLCARAAALEKQSRVDPGLLEEARAELARAIAHAGVGRFGRCTVQLLLAEASLRAQDPEAAEGALEEVERSLASISDEDAGSDAVALLWARLSSLRARAFLGQSAPANASGPALLDELQTRYDAFLEAWGRTPVRAGGIGFLHMSVRRQVLGDLIALHASQDSAHAALVPLLRAHELGSLARRRELRAPSTQPELCALAPADGGLLVYLPAPARSHLFAIRPSGLRHYVLPRQEELIPRGRRLRGLLANAPTPGREQEQLNAIDALASELSELLLPTELRSELDSWHSLGIVGADQLGRLPFEILPGADGARLGLRHALYHLPSLPVAAWLTERAQDSSLAPASDLLLIAATEERESGEPPIAFDPEAGGARLSAPYGSSTVRTGARAWIDADELRAASVLQLVAHGVALLDRERPAALALAPRSAEAESGLVHSSELERLPLPPLVVFASCGAASGPPRLGDDGVADLGGAALLAGARCTILPPGPVGYSSTEDLLSVFHTELAQGQSPAEAMRRARAELAARPGWEHPYHYALLQVVGAGDRPLFVERRTPWGTRVGYGLAGLALAGALGFALRRSRSRGER